MEHAKFDELAICMPGVFSRTPKDLTVNLYEEKQPAVGNMMQVSRHTVDGEG